MKVNRVKLIIFSIVLVLMLASCPPDIKDPVKVTLHFTTPVKKDSQSEVSGYLDLSELKFEYKAESNSKQIKGQPPHGTQNIWTEYTLDETNNIKLDLYPTVEWNLSFRFSKSGTVIYEGILRKTFDEKKSYTGNVELKSNDISGKGTIILHVNLLLAQSNSDSGAAADGTFYPIWHRFNGDELKQKEKIGADSYGLIYDDIVLPGGASQKVTKVDSQIIFSELDYGYHFFYFSYEYPNLSEDDSFPSFDQLYWQPVTVYLNSETVEVDVFLVDNTQYDIPEEYRKDYTVTAVNITAVNDEQFEVTWLTPGVSRSLKVSDSSNYLLLDYFGVDAKYEWRKNESTLIDGSFQGLRYIDRWGNPVLNVGDRVTIIATKTDMDPVITIINIVPDNP